MVHRNEWGKMAALRNNDIISIPLKIALGQTKKVDDKLIEVALGLHDKMAPSRSSNM